MLVERKSKQTEPELMSSPINNPAYDEHYWHCVWDSISNFLATYFTHVYILPLLNFVKDHLCPQLYLLTF